MIELTSTYNFLTHLLLDFLPLEDDVLIGTGTDTQMVQGREKRSISKQQKKIIQ